MKLHVMAWRNIQRNTRRTALSVSAIAVAAMTIVLLFSLLAGLSNELKSNLQTFYFGELRIRHAQYEKHANLNPLHLSVESASRLIAELESSPAVARASARIQFPAAVYEEGNNIGVSAMGLDFSNDLMEPETYLTEGRLPRSGSQEVLLGSSAADSLNKGVGDSFTALSTTLRRASNAMTFEVVGVASFPLADVNSRIYLPVDTVQRFLKTGDRAVDVVMEAADEYSLEDARTAAASVLEGYPQRESLLLETWNRIPSSYIFIRMAQMIYYIAGAVFYVLASTVIINTIMMIIFERTREIGTLASMGMSGKDIVRMFFLESFFISTIGSVAGAAAGAGFTLILENTGIDLTSAMEGVDFELSGIVYPHLTAANILIAVVTGIIVASGISLIPSRRASGIKPVEAMKSI